MEGDFKEISSEDGDDDQTCPLCMEVLEETDRNLYPCSCGYQVCLWCLHYIRNTMGNKCPACRRDYDESNFKYMTKPRTGTSRVSQSKKKRGRIDKEAISKGIKVGTPSNASNGPESLKDVRVIQRNLVYVVGIPLKLAKKEILKKPEYFGQYGNIQHMVINKSNTYNSHWGGSSYTAYVTYSKNSEASAAIQGINSMQTENKYLRASYGTTKYCSYFIKGMKCCNTDCFYLHEFGDEHDRYTKDPLSSRSQIQGLYAGENTQPAIKTLSNYKIKDEQTARQTETHASMKLLSLLQRNKVPDSHTDSPSFNPEGPNKESTSWANVAAGMKALNSANEPVDRTTSSSHSSKGVHIISSIFGGSLPNLPHFNTSAKEKKSHNQRQFDGDNQFEDAGHSMLNNISNSSMADNDLDLNTLSKKLQTIGEPSNTKGVPSAFEGLSSRQKVPTNMNTIGFESDDPTQSIFKIPIDSTLMRYNNCDQLFFVLDVSDQNNSTSESLNHSVAGTPRCNGKPEDARIWKWIYNGANITAMNGSNFDYRRQQLDYYKKNNNIESNFSSEIPKENICPGDLIPDESTVSDIIHKIKRHALLLDNLSRQYNPENKISTANYADIISDKIESKDTNNQDITDSCQQRDVPNDTSSPTIGSSVNWSDNHSSFECYALNILYDPSLDESQLVVHTKIHRQLQSQTEQIVDLHVKRREERHNYLEQLYNT